MDENAISESLPNAITPNGDGLNDQLIFDALFLDTYPNSELVVFNRWGEMLFETADRSQGWDGYYKGELCPSDVYVYRLTVKYLDGREETKIGDVTLLR